MDRRWVILRHTLFEDSLEGLHYDLLLEDIEDCRTWRLSDIPVLNGPFVDAIAIAPHKLYWLEKEESLVSGGRGWAKRIYRGNVFGALPSAKNELLSVDLRSNSNSLRGRLKILDSLCSITSNSKFDFN